MGTLQDMNYKVQAIMTQKDEEASAIDTYKDQLEERIWKFDDVISSLEWAIQLQADSKETNSGEKGQEQKVEFRRKLSRRSSQKK